MTDASSKPSKRRWFQFTLRSLLILVTLVAGLLVAWRVYVEPYRRQRETMKLIEELGGSYKTELGGPAWMRDWFGPDNFQNIVLVDVADCDDPEKYLGQIVSLPCLETLVVGSRNFTDEHLSRLERLTTLIGLILDSTTVTDGGIGAMKQSLTNLAVHKSQRGAIAALRKLDGDIDTQLCGTLPQLQGLVDNEYFKDATAVRFPTFFPAVTDASLVHLKGLTKLQSLDLSSTPVRDTGLAHLKGLMNLQSLSLHDTQVRDAGLAHLKGLMNLQSLSLHDTQVGDTGLAHLRGLTNLRWLDLDCNNVSDAGVEELQQALPNCRVLLFP